MFQIKIKIITTKGSSDKNPRENWIFPDPMFKDFLSIDGLISENLVLYHEKDNHFDLIISNDSELVNFGSLSHRFKINLKSCSKDESNISMAEVLQSTEFEIDALKAKVADQNKSIDSIKKEYSKCEKDLREKVEEAEKLKIELNDLKKIMNLQKQLEDDKANMNKKSEEIETNMEIESRSEHFIIGTFKCDKCSFETNTKSTLESHVKSQHLTHVQVKQNFKCDECNFTSIGYNQLKAHLELHHQSSGNGQLEIKCRICNVAFNDKRSLMKHRKEEHLATVSVCKKYVTGTCPFTASACWWRHEEKKDDQLNLSCYICDKKYESRSELMSHRKKYHIETVPQCSQFVKGICKFQPQFCWFQHCNKDNVNDNTIDTSKVSDKNVDFQKVTKNHDPMSI